MTKQVKEVLAKLDRIELFLAEERSWEKPGTFAWLQYLEAGLSVRAARRQMEAEAKGQITFEKSYVIGGDTLKL